ncbi:MAG: retroviral-like aspartic protease, partial [Candidatus Brocadiaceae bacterium]|nr:retroviral-like aspartic protease [Candidatus Brocadiaceae bacterium]
MKRSQKFKQKLKLTEGNNNNRYSSLKLSNKTKTLDINNISSIQDLFDDEASTDSDYRDSSDSSETDDDEQNIIIINNISGSTMPTIQIQIGQMQYSALLDSGADISVIKLSLTESLKKQNRLTSWDTNPKESRECRGADGSTLKTSGIATLEFSIDDQKFESPFLVLDNLTQDCIIGRIFMKANKMNLDFGTNSVTINNQSYPLGKNSNRNDITSCNFMANQRMSFRQEKYTATLRETTKIKPMETQKLSCSASENTPEGKNYV